MSRSKMAPILVASLSPEHEDAAAGKEEEVHFFQGFARRLLVLVRVTLLAGEGRLTG